MTRTTKKQKIASARAKARRAHILSLIWWATIPVLTIAYWLVSKEPPSERVINLVIADVSFAAMAVTYAGKEQAAEAEAAGYENP